jgi:hypothetical protein
MRTRVSTQVQLFYDKSACDLEVGFLTLKSLLMLVRSLIHAIRVSNIVPM